MMAKNYTDFVEAMSDARADGLSIDRLVLTNESMETFLTDGKFSETTEEKHDKLGEFEVTIERGDDDVLLLENGSEIEL